MDAQIVKHLSSIRYSQGKPLIPWPGAIIAFELPGHSLPWLRLTPANSPTSLSLYGEERQPGLSPQVSTVVGDQRAEFGLHERVSPLSEYLPWTSWTPDEQAGSSLKTRWSHLIPQNKMFIYSTLQMKSWSCFRISSQSAAERGFIAQIELSLKHLIHTFSR